MGCGLRPHKEIEMDPVTHSPMTAKYYTTDGTPMKAWSDVVDLQIKDNGTAVMTLSDGRVVVLTGGMLIAEENA